MKIAKSLLLVLVCLWAWNVGAQTPVQLSPVPRQQFFSPSGTPLAGGLLYTYAAGTTTPIPTYVESSGTLLNSNPIVLDSGGFATIYLGMQAYKLCVADANNVQQWCVDQVNPFQIVSGNTFLGPITFAGIMNATAGGSFAGTFTGNPTLSGNWLFSGNPQFTGAPTTGSLNSIRYVDGIEYPTIAAAVASLPGTGGEVIIPCGTYTLTATLLIPQGVVLAGCGMGTTTAGGTRLVASAGTVTPLVQIQGSSSSVRSGNVFLRDLTIQGVYTALQICMQIDHANYIAQDHVQYVNCGQAEWDDDVYRSLHDDVSYFQSGSGGTNTTATVRVENTSNPSVPAEQIFFNNCTWQGNGSGMQGTSVYFGPATQEERVIASKLDYFSTNPTFPLVYINQANIVDISNNTVSGYSSTIAPGVIEVEGNSGNRAAQVHIENNTTISFSATVPAVYLDYAVNYIVMGDTYQGPGGGTAIVTTANTEGGNIGPFRMDSTDTPVNDVSGFASVQYADTSAGQLDVTSPALFSGKTIQVGRVRSSQGTAQSAGNVTLSTSPSWGTSPPTPTISGTDQLFYLAVTSGSGSPAADPTVTITFATPWVNGAPLCQIARADNLAPLGVQWQYAASTTQLIMTFAGTPAASEPYGASVSCQSR